MAEQQILDKTLSALSLTTVGLEQNQLQSLKQKGITCIGEIYDLQPEGIAAVLGIEFSKAGEIWEKVLKVVSNPEKWSVVTTAQPTCNLPQILISSIDTFFREIDEPKLYIVLVRRFGLNGNRKYTLEEISAYLHVSPERVRQQESRGLRLLSKYLLEPISQGNLFENGNAHLEIDLLKTEVRTIRQLFSDDVEPIKAEKDIHEIIQSRYGVILSENQKVYFRILFEIFGWKFEENAAKNSFSMLPFWVIHREFKPQTIVEAAKQIIKYLQITVVPTSYWDIKVALNKRQSNKFTDLIVRTAIKLTPDIETLDNDYFQVAFHRLRTPDQAYRVLYEKGESMGHRDIFRHVSHRLAMAGEEPPAQRTITNSMVKDKKRFVPIGKSEWALTDRGDEIVSATILNLMVQFFHKKNNHATVQEVYDYVKSKRHVNKSSISWYLSSELDKFVKIGRNLYQLAEWGNPKTGLDVRDSLWTKEKIAELIVSIFDEHKVDVLPVNLLSAEMRKIMRTKRGLYTTLSKNPAVKLSVRSESPRRLEATVIRSYSFNERLTRQEQIEKAIRSILKKQPEQTMRLTELRNLVAKKWSVNPQNVYGYVSNMIDVQKIVVDGSKTVLAMLITEKDREREVIDTWDNEFTYDVAISYASSNRAQAAELAKKFRSKGLRVFYDKDQIPDLIGKNLLDQLWRIYRDKSLLCVILGSQSYNNSVFAQHERQAAQDRNLINPGYIALVKIENTEINYFPSTFQYLDWNEYGSEKIAELVIEKIVKRKNQLMESPSTITKPPTSSEVMNAILETKNLVRSQDSRFNQIDNRLEKLSDEAKASFNGLMRAIADEAKDGPSLFTFRSREAGLSPKQLLARPLNLQLWCEAEGCQHPIIEDGKGLYPIDQPHEWVLKIAPYASFTLNVLKTVAPIAAPAINAFFGPATTETWGIKDQLDLAKVLLDKLPAEVKTSDRALSPGKMLSEPERSGILALHRLLNQLDPNQERLGLHRVATYTGDYRWLCKAHYEAWQPNIPDVIER
jgi:hypothetical protein